MLVSLHFSGQCALPTAMLMPPSTPIWRRPSLEAGDTIRPYTRSSAVTLVGTCEEKLNHSTGTWYVGDSTIEKSIVVLDRVWLNARWTVSYGSCVRATQVN